MKLNFCAACGKKEDLHHHHLKPKVDGGLDVESNLITLCQYCHGIFHNISYRDHGHLTRLGLKKAKERGVKLGSPLNKERSQKARDFALSILPTINQLKEQGITSYNGLAKKLNDMGIKTYRGCDWRPKTVSRTLSYVDKA